MIEYRIYPALSVLTETDGGKLLVPLLLQQAVILRMETEWERRAREMAFRINFKTKTDIL